MEYEPASQPEPPVGRELAVDPPLAGGEDGESMPYPDTPDLDAMDAMLDAVERSLSRIDTQQYGRCERCGSAIDDLTLTAEATAVHCRGCRSE